MIIRILGEGRFELPDGEMSAIERLDSQLVDSLDRSDEAEFSKTLADLIGEVRQKGKLLPADDLTPSSHAVPHEGSTLAEVKALLAQES
ncbi:MAG: PspA-associated protein PspAA [Acidimicrobiales bacterium]